MSLNVFADMGMDNPEEELTKAELVSSLRALIAEKGLTEIKASQSLGLSRVELDGLLLHGGWGNYSLGQLLGFINALDRNVRIIIDSQDVIGETAKTLVLTS